MNLRLIKYFIAFIIVVLLAGCNKSPQDHSNVVVAVVNNHPLYLKDVNSYLTRNDNERDTPLFDLQDTSKILKKELLTLLIDNELLYQEAQRKGIRVSDEEFEKFLSGFRIKSSDVTKEHLSGLTFEEWRDKTRKSFMIRKLINSVVSDKVIVTKQEIYDYFRAHADELGAKKQVRARQIIVDSEIKAREILAQLKKGYNFEALAREVSLSPDSISGGDLGRFSEGQMPPEFDEAIFNLKVNEISDVIRSDYGYHIFQLLEVYNPKPPSLEDSMPTIKEILMQRKRDEAFQSYLDTLHAHATIKINPKALFPHD
ncbi:MAG: peptidylprolyl isomerase [bacterium]